MADPRLRGDASKKRILAFGFDNLIAGGCVLLAVSAFRLESAGVVAFVVTLVYLGYFFAFEAFWSRTPGKAMLGLRIRRLDGTNCNAIEALIRTALRLVEANPLLLGGIPAALAIMSSRQRQRLGDRLADTLVVRNPVPEVVQDPLDHRVLAELD